MKRIKKGRERLGNVTYWNVLQRYHRELYSFGMYWVSAFFLLMGILFFLFAIFSLFAVWIFAAIIASLIGIVLLIIAKLNVLRRKIKI